MLTRKALVLAVGAALVGGTMTALPAPAAPPSAPEVLSRMCFITPTTTSGAQYVSSREYSVPKGKKVSFSFKVTKGCGGTVSVLLGKKVVQTAKFKKNKAKLTIPASKLKKAKRYSVTFRASNTTSKLEYTLWATDGTMSASPSPLTMYENNDALLKTNVKWIGPLSSPRLTFGDGWRPTVKKVYFQSTMMSGVASGKGTTVDTWLRSRPSQSVLAQGQHTVMIDFTHGYGQANPTLKLDVPVTVLSNVLAGPTMPAPGKWVWPGGETPSLCSVTVTGAPPRPSYGESFRGSVATVTGVDILPTDTSIEFKYCGGGPQKIG
ncbi:MAG: hypothetical protein FWD59_06305 [Micrococcales bacterium]|nr:hypothetical protein [Micrococcales bacterium]